MGLGRGPGGPLFVFGGHTEWHHPVLLLSHWLTVGDSLQQIDRQESAVLMAQTPEFPRRPALIAAWSLLIMTGLGPFALLTLQGHVDAGGSAENLAAIADGSRFIGVIAAFLVIAVLDVVIGWALFVVFRDADQRLSLISAILRIIYALALAALVIYLLDARGLAQDGSEAALQSIGDFSSGWLLALGAFGLHLVVLGLVGFKQTNLHNALAGLLVVAGLGYVADAIGPYALSGYAFNAAAYVFFGELLLMVWLFYRAVRS